MKKVLNRIITFIMFYIFSMTIYVLPVLGIVLLFDYLYNFQIDILSQESAFLRIILILWILFVHGVWLKVEFGEKIKKYL